MLRVDFNKKNFFNIYFLFMRYYYFNMLRFNFFFFFKKLNKQKKLKIGIFFFKKKKVKTVVLNSKKKMPNNFYYSPTTILFLKRRYGLFKYKYNPKKYNLFKMNFFINLQKKKIRNITRLLNTFKKKWFNKLFFKKLRNVILPLKTQNKFIFNRQFKKTKLFCLNNNKKNMYNLTIIQMLISFKFFTTYVDAISYMCKVGVLFNNVLVKNPSIFLKKNDKLFLIWVPNYYSYLIKFYTNFKKYIYKVKPRIFKMMQHKRDLNKQSTKIYPKWTLKFIIFKETRFINIEVDFTILAFFVISINNYNYIFSNWNIFYSFYLSRLYNWKYIV